jgi:hypothetical protein
MSESALVPIEEDEELGPRVLKLQLQGLTATQIGKELMIATHQVHKVLDTVLPTIDANYRRRAIAESLVQIDTVIATHMATIVDPDSASVVIRGVCERRALLGGVTGSTDPIQLSMQSTRSCPRPLGPGGARSPLHRAFAIAAGRECRRPRAVILAGVWARDCHDHVHG